MAAVFLSSKQTTVSLKLCRIIGVTAKKIKESATVDNNPVVHLDQRKCSNIGLF